ncbi:MAG: hypothetical protein JXR03_04265 [Cyclobacteriaceae bacterium]
MDNSRFDDIIKSKLESHVDPIGPSGAEVSKMFDGLANVGTATATSMLVKTLVAASGIFLITTIFFIYRTYILEETITSLSGQIVADNLEAEPEVNQLAFSPDSIFWDSIAVITKRVVRQSSSNNDMEAKINGLVAENRRLRQSNASFALSSQDSQRFVNEVMGQLVATLEANPTLLEELFAGVDLQNILMDQSGFLEIRNSEEFSNEKKKVVSKEQKFTNQLSRNNIEALLTEVAKDESSRNALQNLVDGNSPEMSLEEKSDLLSSTDKEGQNEPFDAADLSEEQQVEVLSKYIAYDPEGTKEAAIKIDLDSTEMVTLNRFVDSKSKVIKRNIVAQPEQNLAEVRKDQFKENNKSWWFNGGLGLGSVEVSPTENNFVTSLKAAAEFKPNKRFGFALGANFHRVDGEVYDLTNVDYSNFEDITMNQQSDVKEVKLSLNWMDIPLEAKVYILPNGKINPYVTLSLRARAILKEAYTFETNQSGLLTSDFESGSKFSFPNYGVGTGIRFRVGTKFDGAIQLQKSLGGKKMGPLDIKYNTLQGQALLFYRLD